MDQEPLEKLADQDSPRAIEEEVMKITGTTDLRKVREAMEKYQGDLNGVYSELAEWEYQLAEETVDNDEKPVAKEEQSPPQQTSFASPPLTLPSLNVGDERSEGLHISDQEGQTIEISTISMSSETEIKPAAIHTDVKEPGSAHKSDKGKQEPSETADIALPKKRIPSREKKELAKRKQKLNRKNKHKDNASESSTNLAPKSILSSESSSTAPAGTVSKSMRELFV